MDDLPHLNNMKVILTLNTKLFEHWTLLIIFLFCIDSFHTVHDQVNQILKILFLNFRKNMIKPTLIWLMYLSLIHLIFNAKKLNVKKCGNVYLQHLRGWVFHIFPRLHLITRGRGQGMVAFPQYLLDFLWIIFK